MTMKLGRFTARGGRAVEERITALVRRLSARIVGMASPSQVRAVVLLGGYGRGEGGVERSLGRELPHNNFDLLLVTQGLRGGQQRALRALLTPELRAIGRQDGVGVDLSVMSERRLAGEPSRIMWYDMLHGHKTLAGDAEFVPSLHHFRLDEVDSTDVLRLLVNRGALLILNDYIASRRKPSEDIQRIRLRHTVKAVIGYGDALLFFLGAYHWSYRTRQERMSKRTDVSAPFRTLYDQAMEFRFEPDYREFAFKHPHFEEVARAGVEAVHLRVERLRLASPNLTWKTYAQPFFDDIARVPRGVRPLALWFFHRLRGSRAPHSDPLVSRNSMWASIRERLDFAFPLLAYDVTGPRAPMMVQWALGAETPCRSQLVDRFVQRWGVVGDVNLRIDRPIESGDANTSTTSPRGSTS